MRAVMHCELSFSGLTSAESLLVTFVNFSWDGDNFMSLSSHQSNSVTLSMPEAVNHCLLRSGTKKCTLGCCLMIFMIVGWSI